MQSDELTKTKIEWQVLESLVASGHLSLIDVELAKLLLNGFPDADIAALICHLSLAARNGHLCVNIIQGTIEPDVHSLWNENRSSKNEVAKEDLTEDYLNQIEAAIVHAAEKLPHELYTFIHPSDISFQMQAIQTPLCRMGSRIYFQRYWYYETLFLYYFQRFTQVSPKILLPRETVSKRLLESEAARALMPEQRDAILNACENTLTIICGGPGTGKTHTAGVLICTLWDSLTESEREKFEISLAAPTGKAASNLQKSLLRSAKGVSKLLTLQSKTLHSLLGIKSSASFEETLPLSADLVIVDESSMIDVRLMGKLFASMKPGARLILLGDEHQLPAVEAGSIFADFVHVYTTIEDSAQRQKLQVGKLNKCLRSELQGILDVAAAIKEGDTEAVLQLFDRGDSRGIQRLNLNPVQQNDSAIAKELAAYAFNCFQLEKLGLISEKGVQNCPSILLPEVHPLALLNHFNRFRILSPLRRGPYGVEEINRLISNAYRLALAKNGLYSTAYIAPIMLLKNDYRSELFNGEVGVLVKPHYRFGQSDFELSSGDYGLFAGKDGEIRQIPALLLPAFEYAYCLSVHKSQGSEFDHLLLLLPPGSEHFGRELLYTGVTRARRELTLWGKDDVLRKAIQLKNHRQSGIVERLVER